MQPRHPLRSTDPNPFDAHHIHLTWTTITIPNDSLPIYTNTTKLTPLCYHNIPPLSSTLFPTRVTSSHQFPLSATFIKRTTDCTVRYQHQERQRLKLYQQQQQQQQQQQHEHCHHPLSNTDLLPTISDCQLLIRLLRDQITRLVFTHSSELFPHHLSMIHSNSPRNSNHSFNNNNTYSSPSPTPFTPSAISSLLPHIPRAPQFFFTTQPIQQPQSPQDATSNPSPLAILPHFNLPTWLHQLITRRHIYLNRIQTLPRTIVALPLPIGHLTQPQTLFRFHNQNRQIQSECIGIVIGVIKADDKTIYEVDDGTGPLRCVIWHTTSTLKKFEREKFYNVKNLSDNQQQYRLDQNQREKFMGAVSITGIGAENDMMTNIIFAIGTVIRALGPVSRSRHGMIELNVRAIHPLFLPPSWGLYWDQIGGKKFPHNWLGNDSFNSSNPVQVMDHNGNPASAGVISGPIVQNYLHHILLSSKTRTSATGIINISNPQIPRDETNSISLSLSSPLPPSSSSSPKFPPQHPSNTYPSTIPDREASPLNTSLATSQILCNRDAGSRRNPIIPPNYSLSNLTAIVTRGDSLCSVDEVKAFPDIFNQSQPLVLGAMNYSNFYIQERLSRPQTGNSEKSITTPINAIVPPTIFPDQITNPSSKRSPHTRKSGFSNLNRSLPTPPLSLSEDTPHIDGSGHDQTINQPPENNPELYSLLAYILNPDHILDTQEPITLCAQFLGLVLTQLHAHTRILQTIWSCISKRDSGFYHTATDPTYHPRQEKVVVPFVALHIQRPITGTNPLITAPIQSRPLFEEDVLPSYTFLPHKAPSQHQHHIRYYFCLCQHYTPNQSPYTNPPRAGALPSNHCQKCSRCLNCGQFFMYTVDTTDPNNHASYPTWTPVNIISTIIPDDITLTYPSSAATPPNLDESFISSIPSFDGNSPKKKNTPTLTTQILFKSSPTPNLISSSLSQLPPQSTELFLAIASHFSEMIASGSGDHQRFNPNYRPSLPNPNETDNDNNYTRKQFNDSIGLNEKARGVPLNEKPVPSQYFSAFQEKYFLSFPNNPASKHDERRKYQAQQQQSQQQQQPQQQQPQPPQHPPCLSCQLIRTYSLKSAHLTDSYPEPLNTLLFRTHELVKGSRLFNLDHTTRRQGQQDQTRAPTTNDSIPNNCSSPITQPYIFSFGHHPNLLVNPIDPIPISARLPESIWYSIDHNPFFTPYATQIKNPVCKSGHTTTSATTKTPRALPLMGHSNSIAAPYKKPPRNHIDPSVLINDTLTIEPLIEIVYNILAMRYENFLARSWANSSFLHHDRAHRWVHILEEYLNNPNKLVYSYHYNNNSGNNKIDKDSDDIDKSRDRFSRMPQLLPAVEKPTAANTSHAISLSSTDLTAAMTESELQSTFAPFLCPTPSQCQIPYLPFFDPESHTDQASLTAAVFSALIDHGISRSRTSESNLLYLASKALLALQFQNLIFIFFDSQSRSYSFVINPTKAKVVYS